MAFIDTQSMFALSIGSLDCETLRMDASARDAFCEVKRGWVEMNPFHRPMSWLGSPPQPRVQQPKVSNIHT